MKMLSMIYTYLRVVVVVTYRIGCLPFFKPILVCQTIFSSNLVVSSIQYLWHAGTEKICGSQTRIKGERSYRDCQSIKISIRLGTIPYFPIQRMIGFNSFWKQIVHTPRVSASSTPDSGIQTTWEKMPSLTGVVLAQSASMCHVCRVM